MSGQDAISVPEAASRLGISPDAVRSRIKRGTLTARRDRGHVMVLLDGAWSPAAEARLEPTNRATGSDLELARREIERFSLHVTQLRRERDRLLEQTERQRKFLEHEQALRKRSVEQMEALISLLAAALPEVSGDPKDGADKLWRRLERQLQRLDEPGEAPQARPPDGDGEASPKDRRVEPVRLERAMPRAFVGRWRITEVGEHGRDEIDRPGRATVAFDRDCGGSLRFMGVEAVLDCRSSTRGGAAVVDFTWAGTRNGAPVSGRGWAQALETGGLSGHLWAHGEGDADFTAVKDRP